MLISGYEMSNVKGLIISRIRIGKSNKAICLPFVKWLLSSFIAEEILLGLFTLSKFVWSNTKLLKKLEYKEKVLKKSPSTILKYKDVRKCYCDKNPIIF